MQSDRASICVFFHNPMRLSVLFGTSIRTDKHMCFPGVAQPDVIWHQLSDIYLFVNLYMHILLCSQRL